MSPSIGVLLPNWIGDVVMVTPALRAIRAQHPQAKIIGVARPYVREVLEGLPFLDELLLVDKLGKSAGALWRLGGDLRSRKIETMVLFRRSLPAVSLAWLSGARQRIGYGTGFAAWMLTSNLVPPRAKQGGFAWSTCELYQRLAQAAGCEVKTSALELALLPADEAAADAAWAQLKLPAPERVVLLNAGSANPAKVWPEEHHAALAARLVDEFGVSVLVHCGPKEREQADKIAKLSGRAEVKSLAAVEKLPLGLSKALIRRARMVITSCSGVRHLAAAFARPTLVLAGPIDPATAFSGNPHERTIWLNLDCAPCNQNHCPLHHHRCLRDLSVEQVLGVVRQNWAQPLVRAA